MSFYISIIITVLIIGLLSLMWEQRWKAHKLATSSQTEDAADGAAGTARLPAQLTQGLTTMWAKRPRRKQEPPLADRLRTWATQALASDEKVSSWLQSLSAPAYTAFTEHLAEFADDMGFKLADLVDGRMADLPGVAQNATQIILDYCRAHQLAAHVQDDFDGYRAYAMYRHGPLTSDSLRFTQQLYAKLVEQRLVSAPTPDLLALSDQARLTQMQDAIHQATAQSVEFQLALNRVVAERQHTTADLTVAKIVQQAMTKVSKPVATVVEEAHQ